MKKVVSFVVSVLILLSVLPFSSLAASSNVTSGKTGDCTWELNGTVLTISGNGKMADYNYSAPWGRDITKVIINYGVKNIGNDSFDFCMKLTEISIPESVINIGDSAFSSCQGLTTLTIPSGVKVIGNNAFHFCKNLISIELPTGITSIGTDAFSACYSLTGITIPDSVTSIGDYAFGWCSSLVNITIPDSVTSIGNSAFKNCTSLSKIVISDNVARIGREAFFNTQYYSDDKNWENGVLYIGNHLISGKVSGNYVISNDTKSIAANAFEGCANLIEIKIPDSITNIDAGTFRECVSLTSVEIPNSITNIGEWAFYECSSITDITLPNGVTSIGSETFNRCSSLVNITIPDSVTSIGDYAFGWCSSLVNITIPDSVTSIGNSAFKNCTGLASITIPNSVTNIGDSAFEGCTGLASITVGKNNAVYHSNENCLIETKNKKLIKGCNNSVIPHDGSVTSIGDSAFEWCNNLKSVTIPTSVTSIGNSAFKDCTGLASITIPDSVTNIGDSAFEGCKGLASITIPDSVTNIGDSAFERCTGLASITVGKNNAVYHSNENCLIETKNKKLIKGCNNSVIPHDGSVTNIGDSAFEWCSNLKSIIIPDSVTNIGDSAFRGCSALADITIPDSVTSIGEDAFERCYISELIIADGSKTVTNAMIVCKGTIKSATIPNSVTSIRSSAFEGCSNLKSVTIPTGVTSIGDSAFKNCPNVCIYTTENSAAHKYAVNNNIRYYLTEILTKPSEPILLSLKVAEDGKMEVALKAINGYEYRCNNGEWQQNPTFEGLNFGCQYKFYQRLAKSDKNAVGITSEPLIVRLKNKNNAVPSAPETTLVTFNSITLKRIEGYEYSKDGINWQKSNVFDGLEPNKTYTFYQRIEENDEFYESKSSLGVTVTTLKESPNTPDAPIIISRTNSSVTLQPIDGYEYKMDNGEWQKSNIFSNLDADSTHKFYQRVAETDTIYASKSSDALSVKTYPKNYCTVCLNTGLNSDKTKCAICFGTGRLQIIGDADSDYEITDWDSVLCKRYLAGWDVEIFSKKCFDIDGDRKVTDWDGVLFERYLAGWETDTKINSIVKGYPQHNHVLGDWITDRKATCALAGEEYKVCSICDDIIEERIISKLPHNFENWITDKVSTCYATGEKHHICKECGYNETNVIPKKSHSYGDWIIDKAATCSVFGSRHKVCSVCGASSASESFRELHKYSNWIIDMQPTCSYAGSQHRECTVCGAKNVGSIKQLEHSPGSVTYYDKESTCISHGTGYRLCTKCGGRCNGFQLPLKPHNYVNGKCTYCNQRKN